MSYVSGINCSVGEMPNITEERTDVITVGWDGVTTSYETVIQYVISFL